MKAVRIVSTLMVLNCTALASGRSPSSGVVHIGMTHQELRQVIGAPSGYFADGVRTKLFPRFNSSEVGEVYDRLVEGREYELRVYFLPDNSSRLHPVERVSEARFVADRPQPLRQFLADFNEARVLCAQTCEVVKRTGNPSEKTLDVLSVNAGLEYLQAVPSGRSESEVRDLRSLEGVTSELYLLRTEQRSVEAKWLRDVPIAEWHP